MELIKSFLEDRAERELKMVYFFAQPNGINQKQSLTEFMHGLEESSKSPQTVAEIMSSVKDVLSVFEGG